MAKRFSKGSSFGRLSQSSILIRTHFHANALQDLLDSHVAIPVSHGRNFILGDDTRSRNDTTHVDFGDELNVRGGGRVLFCTMNTQLIKSAVMLRL